jgi:hypothetical protein
MREDRSIPTQLERQKLRQQQLDKGPMHFERKPVRTLCRQACILVVDGREESAVLLDYHGRGFQVSTSRPLLVGTRLSLVLPRCFPVEARVRWSLGGRAGCLFEHPVQEDLIRQAIERASAEEHPE